MARLGTTFCLDTETALAPKCFEPCQARLIQFLNDETQGVFDLLQFDDAAWDNLRCFLERSDLEIYGQSLNFDYRVLLANGIKLGGQFYDTYIASSLIYNGVPKMSHSLAEIAKRELKISVDKSLQAQDWMNVELGEADLAYAMGDVEATWNVAHLLHERIASQNLYDVYRLECSLIPACVDMEHTGMPLDSDAISETIEYYGGEAMSARSLFLETLDSRLQDIGVQGLPRNEDDTFNTRIKETGSVRLGTKRLAGFNLNSSPQVLAYWKQLGIEPADDAGKPSTDKKVLARFQSDELVRLFLNYKRVERRLGMAQKLVEHRKEDGRIHARFMPLATGTGRFSCSTPNLQQVPRDPEFRCAFRAPEGRVLVQADYAAMELRVAAAIANEKAMLDAFNEGVDIHTRTAAVMFGINEEDVDKELRQQAKALNFGALYGSSAKGVQQFCATIGMFISDKKADELLKAWHQAYPAFKLWHWACQERVLRNDPVLTAIKRRRQLFGTESRLTVHANNEVQGTSADIMKCALIEIHRQLPPEAHLIACIHDEVIVECLESDGEMVLGLVLLEMEAAAVPMLGGRVRVKAEGGVLRSWGDK